MVKLFRVKKLSGELGVAESTIYKWVQARRIPYYKINGIVRFGEEEINRWLKRSHKSERKKIEV